MDSIAIVGCSHGGGGELDSAAKIHNIRKRDERAVKRSVYQEQTMGGNGRQILVQSQRVPEPMDEIVLPLSKPRVMCAGRSSRRYWLSELQSNLSVALCSRIPESVSDE